MLIELQALEAAMAQAKYVTGAASILIVNDPEIQCRGYEIPDLDQTQTITIGVFPQPGCE
jgi:hypothetical protein